MAINSAFADGYNSILCQISDNKKDVHSDDDSASKHDKTLAWNIYDQILNDRHLKMKRHNDRVQQTQTTSQANEEAATFCCNTILGLLCDIALGEAL